VPQEKKGRLMKNRLLIVKCKTEGCETDLQVGDMPPDDPRGVSRVLAKSIVPNPGKLTCLSVSRSTTIQARMLVQKAQRKRTARLR